MPLLVSNNVKEQDQKHHHSVAASTSILNSSSHPKKHSSSNSGGGAAKISFNGPSSVATVSSKPNSLNNAYNVTTPTKTSQLSYSNGNLININNATSTAAATAANSCLFRVFANNGSQVASANPNLANLLTNPRHSISIPSSSSSNSSTALKNVSNYASTTSNSMSSPVSQSPSNSNTSLISKQNIIHLKTRRSGSVTSFLPLKEANSNFAATFPGSSVSTTITPIQNAQHNTNSTNNTSTTTTTSHSQSGAMLRHNRNANSKNGTLFF
jgi:hypothetical protein